MTGLSPALLTPSPLELTDARDRLARAGVSHAATYAIVGMEASGRLGEVVRALRRGDLARVARILRWLAALDLAAAERREQIAAADRSAGAA